MEDLSGKVFENLTVLGFDKKSESKKYFWKCICYCGNHVSYRGDLLKSGRRKSCGCIKSPKKYEYLERLKKRLLKNSERVGECLEWKGRFNPFGYGLIKLRSKDLKGIGYSTGAHRASYLVWNGDIPKGIYVLHKCDNKCCIEPSHLFLGTHQENMNDMVSKNRQNKRPGEKHHMKLFSNKDILEIRYIWNNSLDTQVGIAKKYKCHSVTIHNIVRRKSWKHI